MELAGLKVKVNALRCFRNANKMKGTKICYWHINRKEILVFPQILLSYSKTIHSICHVSFHI